MSGNEALDILDEWITDWRGYSETCKAWENRRTALALAIEALREKKMTGRKDPRRSRSLQRVSIFKGG